MQTSEVTLPQILFIAGMGGQPNAGWILHMVTLEEQEIPPLKADFPFSIS
jgi:hypothetical protein